MSTVSGISDVSGITASDASQAIWQLMQQRNTNFQKLSTALQAGNLSGAQQAFASLQQNGQVPTGNSVISSDFDAVGKALQSGDLQAAQTAFQKLQQDRQTMRAAHHHHHHGQGNVQQVNSDTDNSATDSTATSNIINALA